MTYEALAFFTGLLGSMHCLVMCGPLVMSIPWSGNSWWLNLIQRLVYQLGRILTYSAFGFLAGTIGSGFNILGLQQFLSLTTGLLLITIALFHFSGKKVQSINSFSLRFVSPIASQMGHWLSKPYGGLFAGALHGLLPCGMVYMAIAASLNTGSALAGSKFMFLFGLGTTPLLLLVSAAPILLRKFKAPGLLIPALFLLTGSLLIIRSLDQLKISHIHPPVTINHPAPVCK